METIENANHHLIEEEVCKDQNLPSIKFKTGSILIIDKELGELKLFNKNQNVQLIISVKDEGLILNLSAFQLNIDALDEVNIKAKKISIEGTDQIALKTEGNLMQNVGGNSLAKIRGDNESYARVQKITAALGNVELKANDDICLNGERVKLNCD